MVYYVKTVHVQYDDSTSAIDGGDINKGMGWTTTNVYLVAEYTFKRSEAASAFSLLTTYNEDLTAADLSKSDGKPLYRYIRTLWAHDRSQVITKVWLSREKDTQEGDGRTGDINKDRDGDFLYLCWEYGIAPGDEEERTKRQADDDGDDPCPREVPIESLVFSQDSISSEFRNGDDIKAIIDTLRGMSLADRKAIVDLFPILNVVPIPFAGDQYLLSCDNRRLHIFRAILPPGTMITIQNASRQEREKLRWKWTSKDGGLMISVRAKKKEQGGPGPSGDL